MRLGDNANGITMDADRYPDASGRASKQLWVMFKSFAVQISHSSRLKVAEASVADLSTIEEDLMDVLCLTQPDDPCIMPAPMEELRPHAKRILSSSTPYTCSLIPREDFLSLLRLVLSIQLDKPEWGPSHEPPCHTGRIFVQPRSDILQGASEAILRLFTPSENKDVDWPVFKNILSLYLVRLLCSTHHVSITAWLMTASKAGLHSTISSHLYILSFSFTHTSSGYQPVNTKHEPPYPIRPVPQSFPIPSAIPPETPRLRRFRNGGWERPICGL